MMVRIAPDQLSLDHIPALNGAVSEVDALRGDLAREQELLSVLDTLIRSDSVPSLGNWDSEKARERRLAEHLDRRAATERTIALLERRLARKESDLRTLPPGVAGDIRAAGASTP